MSPSTPFHSLEEEIGQCSKSTPKRKALRAQGCPKTLAEKTGNKKGELDKELKSCFLGIHPKKSIWFLGLLTLRQQPTALKIRDADEKNNSSVITLTCGLS